MSLLLQKTNVATSMIETEKKALEETTYEEWEISFSTSDHVWA